MIFIRIGYDFVGGMFVLCAWHGGVVRIRLFCADNLVFRSDIVSFCALMHLVRAVSTGFCAVTLVLCG